MTQSGNLTRYYSEELIEDEQMELFQSLPDLYELLENSPPRQLIDGAPLNSDGTPWKGVL